MPKTKRSSSKHKTAISIAKRALTKVNAMQPEVKFSDVVNIAAQTIDYNGLTFPMGNLTQTLNDAGRIGDNVRWLNLQIKGHFYVDTLIPNGSTQSCRILVVVDKVGTGTVAATPATILQVLGATQAVYSPLNASQDNRFKILADKIVNISRDGPSGQVFSIFKKIPKSLARATFSGTGANTIGRNGITVLLMSNAGAALPACTLYGRLTYTDC